MRVDILIRQLKMGYIAMNDDVFEFDIDAELAAAEENVSKKAQVIPEPPAEEEDCEGCKI